MGIFYSWVLKAVLWKYTRQWCVPVLTDTVREAMEGAGRVSNCDFTHQEIIM